MENQQALKTTLFDFHQSAGANMALFGGYEMPLWYSGGAKAEHLVVIEKAGIFDTSHMSVIKVKGVGAKDLLQHCFTKDLDCCIGAKKLPLTIGRCVYGLFLDEEGCVIDDALLYMLAEESYMIVVNAAMGDPVCRHLKNNLETELVTIEDLTGVVGKMDLQGPLSARILAKVVKAPDELFTALPYFSFKGSVGACQSATQVELLDGTSFMVSRTGYTGEFGFEFFIEREKLVHLWDIILEAGKDEGLLPCGLAARDSLRAGAVLPLSHQDIGRWVFANNPWPFALPWKDDGFSKDFIGCDIVAEKVEDEFTYAFAGFDPRKIQSGDDTVVENLAGETIGRVLTCATDMAIGRVDDEIYSLASPVDSGRPLEFRPRGLSCGFILVNRPLDFGDLVHLVAGKRKIKVEIRQDIRPHRTARKAITSMLEG